ncbi:transglutaminase domain-containing protein [Azospirillum sp. ST 5-10]|uniref:transglutaminase domain-containing protein n=1 Tax=unclassified Azospirillum TaxID=2630922 RepID=UPI003F4A5797
MATHPMPTAVGLKRPVGRGRRIALATLSILLAAGVAILAWNDVPSTIPAADRGAAAALMTAALPGWSGFAAPDGFAAEIALVTAVQDAVLGAAPIDRGLPLGGSRDLADVVAAGYGLCYDRSRAIETVLRLHGMATRHVAVYSMAEAGSAWRALMTSGTASHAVTEVLTERGWLVVDSNARWIALTADGRPLDMPALRRTTGTAWAKPGMAPINPIFTGPFTWVYGLYSRHGRFYPPYTPVPDVDWAEFSHNFR